MRFTRPTKKQRDVIEALEEGSNTSDYLVCTVDGEMLVVRVMGKLLANAEIDFVVEHLLAAPRTTTEVA